MKKVSVCIPVYGVEKFIERCAKSILEQDYPELDIIFVDDRSKDNSISILNDLLDEYPLRAKQVRVISHLSNRGLAAARNTAVSNAIGDFILHVDGDDYISSNFVSSLIQEQTKGDFDIVFGAFTILQKGKRVLRTMPVKLSLHDLLLKVLSLQLPHNVCGALIRSSLYRNNDISNIEGVNNTEDLQIMPKLLYYACSYSVNNNSFYYYDCSSNSTSYTNKPRVSSSRQAWVTFDDLFKFFGKGQIEYLEALSQGKALNLSMQMTRWSQYKEESVYYLELVNMSKHIASKTLKNIPIKYRVVLLIKKRFWVALYVRLNKLIKKLHV